MAARVVYQSVRMDVAASLCDVSRGSLSSFKHEFSKRPQGGLRPRRTIIPREVDGFYMLLLDIEDINERIYGGTLTEVEHREAYDELLGIFRPQFLESIPLNFRISKGWFQLSNKSRYNAAFVKALQAYLREHYVPIKELFDVENFDEEATLWYLRGYTKERHPA